MKKEYAIISRDRHRDDHVYLFTGTKEEVEQKCEEIWKQDFGYDYEYKWVAGGGSYTVDYVEVIKLTK